uniref:Uncharacterized protein n=1 Tax=Ciona intestinalis TaxID=7719 RepID=H2Y2T5_CIOIN
MTQSSNENHLTDNWNHVQIFVSNKVNVSCTFNDCQRLSVLGINLWVYK